MPLLSGGLVPVPSFCFWLFSSPCSEFDTLHGHYGKFKTIGRASRTPRLWAELGSDNVTSNRLGIFSSPSEQNLFWTGRWSNIILLQWPCFLISNITKPWCSPGLRCNNKGEGQGFVSTVNCLEIDSSCPDGIIMSEDSADNFIKVIWMH